MKPRADFSQSRYVLGLPTAMRFSVPGGGPVASCLCEHKFLIDKFLIKVSVSTVLDHKKNDIIMVSHDPFMRNLE